MPGSPSISTEPPRPPATSFMNPASIAVSLSRPTSAPARVAVGTGRILLLEHYGHKWRFRCNSLAQIRLSVAMASLALPHRALQVSQDLQCTDTRILLSIKTRTFLAISFCNFHYSLSTRNSHPRHLKYQVQNSNSAERP